MDLFEESVQLVKVLLEEGIQPLKLPQAASQLVGQERSKQQELLRQDR